MKPLNPPDGRRFRFLKTASYTRRGHTHTHRFLRMEKRRSANARNRKRGSYRWHCLRLNIQYANNDKMHLRSVMLLLFFFPLTISTDSHFQFKYNHEHHWREQSLTFLIFYLFFFCCCCCKFTVLSWLVSSLDLCASVLSCKHEVVFK